MKLAMIGAGYVGLTTGACLAQLGHDVVIFDISRDRISQLRTGQMPIFEPGLDDLVREVGAAGRLSFTDDASRAVKGAAAVFLAVGTPSRDSGEIDLAQIDGAAATIAPHLDAKSLVVIKSTVSVGTARRVREIIAQRRGRSDIMVASNPEFLREGSAIADFMKPDRIVLGFDQPQAGRVLDQIYAALAPVAPICRTSIADAELTKHVANAFLAVKIGFANEVADLCEAVDGDVGAVMEAVGLDRRIGRAFLSAGPGYGGSCFPKDTRAFVHSGRSRNAPQRVVEAIVAANGRRPLQLAQRIIAGADLEPGSTVGLLGIAFKANTDDIRESPALQIARHLLAAGLRLRLHDPRAARNARQVLTGSAEWVESPRDVFKGADAVVLATEWEDYRGIDLRAASRTMSGRHFFDFRNLLDPEAARGAGLVYHSIGRATLVPRDIERTRRSGGAVLPHAAAASKV